MNTIRKLFAIWIAKSTIILSKLLGKKGSSTPGKIALKIYPNILKDLAKKIKKEIIVVCGTNGKTTTNNMLYSLLAANGYKVVCNKLGANMLDGITTAFIDAATIFGNLHADYAAMEVDEASTVKVFDHFIPSKIVITNLFRDQLDRYGEVDITMDLLKQALKKTPDTQLILNGDDPLTSSFGQEQNRTCYYFGIDQNLQTELKETKEGHFCTLCGEELDYEYYHYSQLGKYSCPNCDFKRPNLDFKAVDINLENGLCFYLNWDDSSNYIQANYRGFYNIYNILASISVGLLLDINTETINEVLNNYKPQIGRMESFDLGKPVILNLSKNPAGFNQAISTLLQDPRDKDIMVIINDKAQDGKDISWIWDVDFERLKEASVKNYVLSGIRKDDLAVRFKYAEIDEKLFTVKDDVKEAIEELITYSGEVCYILVNYTALFKTQEILKKQEIQ